MKLKAKKIFFHLFVDTLCLLFGAFLLINTLQVGQSVYSGKKYSFIHDLEKYNQQWLKMEPRVKVHELSNLTLQKERCGYQSCKYFVYEYLYRENYYEAKNLQFAEVDFQQYSNNLTIFIVAGLHGNQQIGPIAILNAYPILADINPYRMLIFAIANPSGYSKYQRLTFPGNIDANRDFPFDKNKNCYRTDSTFVIDYVYRNWKVDLSISLHNGGNQIGWSWGSFGHQNNPYAVQQPINLDIGTAMKYHGGSNKMISMSPFNIGTMTQSVYSASGTYEDWAYAGSWQKNQLKCKEGKQYEQYPLNMTRSLILLFQLGPHNVKQIFLGSASGVDINPNQQSARNGYISRAIRMLKQLVYIIRPKLRLAASDQFFYMQLKGCKTAQINLTLQRYQQLTSKQQNRTAQRQPQQIERFSKTIKGSLFVDAQQKDQSNQYPKVVQKIQFSSLGQIGFTYQFSCDPSWNKLGETAFAQPRIVRGSGKIVKKDNSLDLYAQNQLQKTFVVTSILLAIGIVFCLFVCYLIRRNRKMKMIQNQEECQEAKSSNNEIEAIQTENLSF